MSLVGGATVGDCARDEVEADVGVGAPASVEASEESENQNTGSSANQSVRANRCIVSTPGLYYGIVLGMQVLHSLHQCYVFTGSSIPCPAYFVKRRN